MNPELSEASADRLEFLPAGAWFFEYRPPSMYGPVYEHRLSSLTWKNGTDYLSRLLAWVDDRLAICGATLDTTPGHGSVSTDFLKHAYGVKRCEICDSVANRYHLA